MKHAPITTSRRKPVNLSIDTGIVAAARELGINMSRVTEDALRKATRDVMAERWLIENRATLADYNRWYDDQGDPLAHLPPL